MAGFDVTLLRWLTLVSDDLIIISMGGRYGKYGEIKRLRRLRDSKRDLMRSQGGLRFAKDLAHKPRSARKRLRHVDSKG